MEITNLSPAMKKEFAHNGKIINAVFTENKIDPQSQEDNIAYHFSKIMETLGLDLEDDGLKDTPQRVAKMYVQEIFKGLNPANEPDITLFENKFKYNEMIVEKDIPLYSYCEHHFVPIIGKAHVAYISKGKVIGLSKLNRIVDYYARRPQIQERLTLQIAEHVKKVLQTQDVAVILKASHLCIASRGVAQQGCETITNSLHGSFINTVNKQELFTLINL
ncbi:MAG: GTP cyclohydrolase I FolE [Niastella sp.]|nr:GTP cyclohydrolase I FolE [Niastella sp.]